MFKRELKVNFKSFCVWALVSIALYLIVFLIYPSIVNGPEVESLNEMLKAFPEEILKAFNMDLSSIDSVYGWLKSEGFIFVLLIIGCYSGILGSNILLKEESDKTSEYLGVLPIKKSSIVLSKCLVGIIYITALTIVIGLFNYIGLELSGRFNEKQYILLSITPLFASYVLFFLCMFISTFTSKTKTMLGVSLGVVIISYALNILSSLSENTEFLKYFSAFTLSDIRNVITNISIDIKMIIVSFVLCLILLLANIFRYNKKEFV